MKIQPINNNQHQHTNSTNFNGKLILPEKMSNIGKQFVDKCGERITKILEPEPYDMFLHEIPVNKNDKKIVLIYNQEAEPKFPVRAVLNNIITEFNDRMELYTLKLEFERLNLPEIVEMIIEKPNKEKPFVPLKIGKPQKPYIKPKKNFYKK